MATHHYIYDQLNAPRITRFGREIKTVGYIRIGRKDGRAALFFNRDELPSVDSIEFQLERQHCELRSFKATGEYGMLGYRRE